MNDREQNKNDAQGFAIQRIYVKDCSFESPQSPHIFRQQWEPELNLELSNESESLGNNDYDITLRVMATVKKSEQVAFLAEVHQAGIFTISGFDNEQHGHMEGSYCPNILYPYARAIITDMSVRAGFPPLYLAPVNFDMFYAEQLKRNSADVQNEHGKLSSGETGTNN